MIPNGSFERRKALGWAFAFIWVATQMACIPALRAQPAVGTVSTSMGVDTTFAEVGAIVTVMRAYLARPDASDYRSEWWSTRDDRDRLAGDLAAALAYQDYPATIVGVMGTDAGDSLYVVKTLYARPDTNTHAIRTLALQRIYAVREAGGWRLSNALPRLTRGWQRLQAGRITYWYEPGQEAHPDAVRRAGRFVDSVAALFGVTPPAKLDYYVTGSIDAAYHIIGLEFFVFASGPSEELGGLTLPRAGIVLSGDPALGDSYLHELVHATLGALRPPTICLAKGWPLGWAGPRVDHFARWSAF